MSGCCLTPMPYREDGRTGCLMCGRTYSDVPSILERMASNATPEIALTVNATAGSPARSLGPRMDTDARAVLDRVSAEFGIRGRLRRSLVAAVQPSLLDGEGMS